MKAAFFNGCITQCMAWRDRSLVTVRCYPLVAQASYCMDSVLVGRVTSGDMKSSIYFALFSTHHCILDDRAALAFFGGTCLFFRQLVGLYPLYIKSLLDPVT